MQRTKEKQKKGKKSVTALRAKRYWCCAVNAQNNGRQFIATSCDLGTAATSHVLFSWMQRDMEIEPGTDPKHRKRNQIIYSLIFIIWETQEPNRMHETEANRFGEPARKPSESSRINVRFT